MVHVSVRDCSRLTLRAVVKRLTTEECSLFRPYIYAQMPLPHNPYFTCYGTLKVVLRKICTVSRVKKAIQPNSWCRLSNNLIDVGDQHVKFHHGCEALVCSQAYCCQQAVVLKFLVKRHDVLFLRPNWNLTRWHHAALRLLSWSKARSTL